MCFQMVFWKSTPQDSDSACVWCMCWVYDGSGRDICICMHFAQVSTTHLRSPAHSMYKQIRACSPSYNIVVSQPHTYQRACCTKFAMYSSTHPRANIFAHTVYLVLTRKRKSLHSSLPGRHLGLGELGLSALLLVVALVGVLSQKEQTDSDLNTLLVLGRRMFMFTAISGTFYYKKNIRANFFLADLTYMLKDCIQT